jgi:hypothetical protein
MGHLPEIRPHGPNWNESPAGGWNPYPFQRLGKLPEAWFQDPGNRIPGLAELSVFRGNLFKMGSCYGPSSPPFPPGGPSTNFGAWE